MRKLTAIALASVMTVSMCSAAVVTHADDVDLTGKKVCLILPGSIDDQGWNATNNAGAKAAEAELGITIDVIESVPAEEYESTFVEYGEKGYDLIMAAGSQFDESATTVAEDYPDSIFCAINGQVSDFDNQCPVFPKEYEGSIVAGVLAGYATENGQFATMGGESNDPMVKLLDTYEGKAIEIATERGIEGAAATRSFVNSWTDVSATKDMTSSMIDNGADTVFCYSNEGTSGAIQAAQEKGKTFIGFSSNKNGESDCVYGSVAMDWAAVYPTIIRNLLSGEWTGRTDIGVAEGVFTVEYTDKCTDECKAAVDQLVQDIKDGKVDFEQYFAK
ncbi:MAG: BMP family protein [Lachnospiraceae bacterium]|nr:BMP family protein [Lachnospiraceae bacterium]